MIGRLALAFWFATIAFPAFAQDVSGRYTVEGRNFDGSRYRGTAEIAVTSKNTCRIRWNVGSVSEGICMRNGSVFAASYGEGGVIGLVIYEIRPDGRMEGPLDHGRPRRRRDRDADPAVVPNRLSSVGPAAIHPATFQPGQSQEPPWPSNAPSP